METILTQLIIKHNYTKFIIAMNDVSLYFSLERKTNNISFKYLQEDCKVYYHYIDRLTDNGEMLKAKLKVFYDKIKNIDNDVYEIINDLYPNIINDMLLELSNHKDDIFKVNISEQLIKRVNQWW